MAEAGFSVGTFTGGGTFLVESLSGTLTPVGKVAWGGAGTVNRVGPTMAAALPVGIYGGTLNAGTVDKVSSGTINTVGTLQAGTVTVSNTGTVVGTVAISTIAAGTVVAAGTLSTAVVPGTTAARGTFVGTADAQLLAANASRTGAWFANDSDQSLYLGLGTAAVSTATYSKIIPAGGFLAFDGFTGEVRGLMGGSVASGSVRQSEVTK